MLILFVLLYLLFNMGIGYWASRRVHNTKDSLLAGRQLPFYISTTVVFATWFGSETLLGASSEFAAHGLLGVIEDPFGAALCLVLVGVFFAKRLYRMNLLTLGDYYRVRFNKTTEQLAAFFMVISYFGWIAAQMVALGIVMNQVFGISTTSGILIGSGIVVGYTFLGGMWSVSVTDFVQSVMIIGGLLYMLGVDAGTGPNKAATSKSAAYIAGSAEENISKNPPSKVNASRDLLHRDITHP